MPIIPCPIALKECLPCNDDPIRNLSAEDPDRDRFIGIFHFILDNIPGGWKFGQPDSKALCYSETSQDEADDCAMTMAEEDVDKTIKDQNGAPVPLFHNIAVTRTSTCPDGSTFSWTIPAGTFVAFSQIEANAIAASVAKLRATLNRICIINSALSGGCQNETYTVTIQAVGGTALYFPYVLGPLTPFSFVGCGENFDPIRYTWQLISGSLPPGLELDECTGRIEGTPTATGQYTFRVRATDAIGSFQEKTLTLCVIKINNASPLPDATEGQFYLENLTETGGTQESEVWEIVSGSLPAGLTLSAAGVLSGTPTESGDLSFRVRVTVGVCT